MWAQLTNNVRNTALALTVFAQFADPICSQVIKLMHHPNFIIIDGGGADPMMGYAMQQYYEKPKLASKVLQLLKKMDLGIQDLKVIREPFPEAHLKSIPKELKPFINPSNDVLRAVTLHKMHDALEDGHRVEFDLNNQESYGTRRLFVLMMLLVQTLDAGGVFVFDELGSSIHPFMSKEIIGLFQNRNTNPKGAQLVFCSHETYLLSKPVGLRQDQIWFTEKNTQEETVLIAL